MSPSTPFVVLKYGGTSVAGWRQWEGIAARVRAVVDEGARPVVVCSAAAGVTSALEACIDRAVDAGEIGGADAIVERHRALAGELGVSAGEIDGECDALRRLLTGIALLGEAGPRVRARVLALGERMSTRLGAAFLRAVGLEARWLDAATALAAVAPRGIPEPRRWLQAEVDCTPDPALQRRLRAYPVVVTQGFVAGAPGGVALLGRGGSDTSAAAFAARLGAVRCEIWTDVPGMFTANPRKVPGARLLRRLDYDEAQEIATTGARVLHPRCLAPVRDAGIPLHVRCTEAPELPGTVISRGRGAGPPRVKAISQRDGIALVSMETLGMWQQVGFLADVFAVFKELGLSVDAVSTSETNVTATLDPVANPDPPLDALVDALSPHCAARVVRGCASVSLVGRGIRAILHRLAPVFALFEDHRVHLVTQAASDLNLTVVVDAADADRLVDRLHAALFAHRPADDELGPTWDELVAPRPPPPEPASWITRRAPELRALRHRTPIYVYDAPTLRARAEAIVAMTAVDRVLYAVKANPHPAVLDLLGACGLDFETVSLGEIDRVTGRFDPARVLFTPNFAPRDEYAAALARGVRVTLDNLHPLARWPDLFRDRDVFLRVDPGTGRGHHDKVRTAGARSKFGVCADQLDEAARLADAAGARVVGLHAHVGSGVLEPTAWRDTAAFLASVRHRFPDVRVLDVGGGLGVPDRPGGTGLDLDAVDRALCAVREAHPDLALWLEPGRFLVAEAGVLLVRVTQTKVKGDRWFVGVDAGMNALIRPMLYGAWHPILPLDRPGALRERVADVVGPICESGDVLGHGRSLPVDTGEGDLLAVGLAGAYGASMASAYNLRPRPEELLLD